MNGAPEVSVLIPHAGNTTRLERCLDSLRSDRLREVLVVLPGTARHSLALVERHPRGRPVVVPRLLSFARATNLAASMATGELLFLLNDDTVVQDGAIDRLADEFVEQPDLGAAGPLLLNLDGTLQPSVYSDPSWRTLLELILQPLFRRGPLARRARFPHTRPPMLSGEPIWLSGAALMVRRHEFEEIGALDEGYPHGIEDAALCRAIRNRGHRLALVDDARIVHEHGVSSYRSRAGSEQVARALVGGTTGWIHYWRANGAGPASTALIRTAFVFFGLTRLAVYSIGSVLPGRQRARRLHKRDAYAAYMRRMLSRSTREPLG